MLKSLATLSATVCTKAVATIAIFVFAATRWDSAIYGSFMYCFAVGSILVIFCEYGFTNQLLKDSQNKGRPFIVELFNAKLVLGLLVIALAHWAHATFENVAAGYFLPLLYSILFNSFFDFVSTAFRANNKISVDFNLSIVFSTVFAASSAVFLLYGADAESMAWLFCVVRFFSAIVSILLFKKVFGYLPMDFSRVWPRKIAITISRGFFYASDTAINSILNVVDGILLTHFAGAASNGVYQAAARLNQSIPIAFSVLTAFFLPKLADSKGAHKFKSRAGQFLVFTAMAWLAVAAFFLVAYWLYMRTPDGSVMHVAAPLLFGLAGVALLRFLCGWMSALLIAKNKQQHKTAAYAIALGVIAGSSVYVVPPLGAWGIMASYALGFAACFLLMCPTTFKIYTEN